MNRLSLPTRAWRLLALAAALAIVAGTGCYKVAYSTGAPASAETHREWSHFFFWGLAGKDRIDVPSACPEGMSTLVIRNTAGTWLASVVTLGLYSPLQATLRCAAPAHATEGPAPARRSARTGEDRP